MKGFRKKAVAILSAGCLVASSAFSMPVHATEAEEISPKITWEEIDLNEEDMAISVSTLEEIPEETEESAFQADDTVRVFIVFEGESAIEKGYSTENIAENERALDYMEQLENEHEEVLTKVSEEVLDGEEVDVRYDFTLATNAVSAEVTYSDIEAIAEVEGVEAVYLVPVYEVPKDEVSDEIRTTTAAEMVGSNVSWLEGYTGAGMRVAVVDTGLDMDHELFDAGAFEYSLEQIAEAKGVTVDSFGLLETEEINSVLDRLNASSMYPGLSASQVYRNTKVPYAFNYVDEDLRVTHDDSQSDHGTHVAGIAVGNSYVPAGDAYASSAETVHAQGVAPDAQLFVMKVFGNGGGAYSDDYAAAIEDAVMLGADAVNLSLGSSAQGFTTISDEYVQGVFDSLAKTETVVSISSGNNGYWSQEAERDIPANNSADLNLATNGSPGTYTNSLAVASVDNIGVTGVFLEGNHEVSFSFTESSGYGNEPITSLDSEADADGTDYEYVMFAPGIAGDEDGLYDNVDVTGKIVLVQRGGISFYVKANTAAAHGAAAVMIYNNQPGTISMNLEGYEHTAPVVSITQEAGNAIAATGEYDEEKGIYTGIITIKQDIRSMVTDAPMQMSDFSSWGANENLNIKPEITAPGGNIYSSTDGGNYESWNGTSMAAPSVAGMIALVKQYVEENGIAKKLGLNPRVLIQSLLMGTASPIIDPNSEVEYSVRQQGAGLGNAYAAVSSDAYILVDGQPDGKVKAEFGDDPEKTGVYSFTFSINNLKDETIYYRLDESVLTPGLFGYNDEIYMDISDMPLDASVEYAISASPLFYDYSGDGSVDVNDALAVLQYANKKVTLSPSQALNADFDGDGKVTTNDAQILLAAIVNGNPSFDFTKTSASMGDNMVVVNPYGTATITATITLADSDKEMFEAYYPNGGYVEGYVYLRAVADAEGVVASVDQSIPFLGVYGNWTDSSMFERSVYIDDLTANDFKENYVSHSGYTNYFILSQGGNSYYFAPNPYALDKVDGEIVYLEDEYLSDRNAISTAKGDSISTVDFSLIRNAANIIVSVVNAETGEIYYSENHGSAYAEYYNSNNSAWANLSTKLPIDWAGTDAEGNELPEGTKVVISLTALPEYYNDGTHVPGEGASLTLPLTIDNTAPEATEIALDEDGNLAVTVKDNRYTASAVLLDASGRDILDSKVLNQTEPGASVSVTFEEPSENIEEDLRIFILAVCDYAGNESYYRVNFDAENGFTHYAESVTLSDEAITVLKGAQATLTAEVRPYTVEDISVIWTSSDESVATVNENGVVTGISAGTALITATSVLLNEEGEEVSATCEVTVESIDADLNAVLWDAEGDVNLTSFNTTDLLDTTVIKGDLPVDLMSVAAAGDVLFAAGYGSSSEQMSDIYVLDVANDYEPTYLNTTYWMTDMAIAPHAYSAGAIYGTYGPYIVLYDIANNAFDGVLNTSSKTGGDYLVGISYAFSAYNSYYGVYFDYYYVLTQSGEVFVFYIADLDGAGNIGYGVIDTGSCGITSESLYWNSLQYYFDEETMDEYLFYSSFDPSNQEQNFYAVKLDSRGYATEATHLGTFAASVWPVSGLYLPEDVNTGVNAETRASLEAMTATELEVATLETEVSFSLPVTSASKELKLAAAAATEVSEEVSNETEAVLEETQSETETDEEEKSDEVTEETENESEEAEAATETTDEEASDSAEGQETSEEVDETESEFVNEGGQE